MFTASSGMVDMSSCLCCGPAAVEQGRLDAYLKKSDAREFNPPRRKVVCSSKSCRREQNFTCAMEFCSRIHTYNISKAVQGASPWVSQMMPIYKGILRGQPLPSGNISVPNCMSCELSSKIPAGLKTSLPLMSVPDPIFALPTSQDRPALTRKEGLQQAVKQLKNLPSTKQDSMDFLAKYEHFNMKPKKLSKLIKSRGTQAKHSNFQGDLLADEFAGALYIPSHKIIICSYACNDSLYVDIHGLAKSELDNTPTIPHMVLSTADGVALSAKLKGLEEDLVKQKYLSDEDFRPVRLDDVPLPESELKTRSWQLDYSVLPQQVKIDDVEKLNGRTEVPLEELMQCKILSWRNMRMKAEQVIVCADFQLETDSVLQAQGRKLICQRLQRTVLQKIDDKHVSIMYNYLLPSAGRAGVEVVRTGGTAGTTNTQSHKDMLHVLQQNGSMLPNKAGACLILPDKKKYFILYKKHKFEVEHPIAITTYAPPKPGGSLLI